MALKVAIVRSPTTVPNTLFAAHRVPFVMCLMTLVLSSVATVVSSYHQGTIMIAPVTDHTGASSSSHLSDLIAPLMDDTSESALHFSPSTIVPDMLTARAATTATARTTVRATTPTVRVTGATAVTASTIEEDNVYNDSSTGYFDPMIHQVTTSASSSNKHESVTDDPSARSSTNEVQSVTVNDNNNMRSLVSAPQKVTALQSVKSVKSVKSSSSSIKSASSGSSTPPLLPASSIASPHKTPDLRAIKSNGNFISTLSQGKNVKSHQSHDEKWPSFSLKSWESKRNKMTSSSPGNSRFNKLRERNLPFLKPQLKEQLHLHSSEMKRKSNRISYASNIKTRKSGDIASNSATGLYPRSISSTKLPHVQPEHSPSDSTDLSLQESKSDHSAPVDIVGRRAGLSRFYFNMRRDTLATSPSPSVAYTVTNGRRFPSSRGVIVDDALTEGNALSPVSPSASSSASIPKLLLPNFKRPRMYSLDGYIPKPNLQKFERTRAPKNDVNVIEESNVDDLKSNNIIKRQGDLSPSLLRRKAAYSTLLDLSSSESNYEHHSTPVDRVVSRDTLTQGNIRRRGYHKSSSSFNESDPRTIPKLLLPQFTRPRMYSLNGFIPKPNLHRLSHFSRVPGDRSVTSVSSVSNTNSQTGRRRDSDAHSINKRKDDDLDVTLIASKDTPAPVVHVPRLFASSSNNRYQNKVPAMRGERDQQKLTPNESNERERRRKFFTSGHLFNLNTRRIIANRTLFKRQSSPSV